jgi:hypothetical protein
MRQDDRWRPGAVGGRAVGPPRRGRVVAADRNLGGRDDVPARKKRRPRRKPWTQDLDEEVVRAVGFDAGGIGSLTGLSDPEKRPCEPDHKNASSVCDRACGNRTRGIDPTNRERVAAGHVPGFEEGPNADVGGARCLLLPGSSVGGPPCLHDGIEGRGRETGDRREHVQGDRGDEASPPTPGSHGEFRRATVTAVTSRRSRASSSPGGDGARSTTVTCAIRSLASDPLRTCVASRST